jgi:hypothetical protein
LPQKPPTFGRSGAEFIKNIHAIQPNLPILVLSMHDEMPSGEGIAGGRARLFHQAVRWVEKQRGKTLKGSWG